MNEVIKTMLNHRSIRAYLNREVSHEDLDLIIRSAQAAPSSVNGQHVSIIVVKDLEKRRKMAELCGNQVYIEEAPVFLIFCQDYYRAHLACQKQGVEIKIVDRLEASLVGGIDVGLAMGYAINAAESLGLGTVPIGGIRNNPAAVCELLDLPEYVFPLCGLVVGYPRDHSALKPRFNKTAVAFDEQYNLDLQSEIEAYDEVMKNYMLERTNGKDSRNWSETIARYYKNESKRDILTEMSHQGFKNK